MTITEITTLLSAVAAFVTSMAGIYVNIRNSGRNATKIDENTALTKESAKKIDEVHAATDVIKAATGNLDVSAIRKPTQGV